MVSPLDTPAGSTRALSQSFSGLALGGEAPNLGWGGQAHAAELPQSTVAPATRSAGWGAVDEAWGGSASQAGWDGDNEANFVGQTSRPEQNESGFKDGESGSASGHSRKMSESNESEDSAREQDIDTGMGMGVSRSGTPQVRIPFSESIFGPLILAFSNLHLGLVYLTRVARSLSRLEILKRLETHSIRISSILSQLR